MEKVVPRVMGVLDSTDANCLWAQMIERAYAAGGFHAKQMNGEKGYRVDQKKADAQYEMMKKKWGNIDEEDKKDYRDTFPYLFDKEGNMKKWEPSYNEVEGGFSGRFLELLLGPTHKTESIDPRKVELENDERTENSSLYEDSLGNMVDDAWEREGTKGKVDSDFIFFRLITHSDHNPATPEEKMRN